MEDSEIINICEQAGVEFAGCQDDGNGEQLVLFNDPLTHSTLALHKKKFNNPAAQAKVTKHRLKYGFDLKYQSDFMDAMTFITRDRIIPHGVIRDAAAAAVAIIKRHIDEEKANGTEENKAA